MEEKNVAKKAWNEIYKKELGLSPIQKDMPKIVELFKERNVKRVLDLGCGTGRHIIYLAKHGFEVYGIDISNEGIKTTKYWLTKHNLKARLKVGDIYKRLPYEDNFFDAIISIKTLHHGKIEDIRRLIKEMKRILKPKGLIFIEFPKKRPKREIPKERLYGIKFIAPRTYIILGGEEKGVPHSSFNKRIIRKELKGFKILWDGYSFLGELKSKNKILEIKARRFIE